MWRISCRTRAPVVKSIKIADVMPAGGAAARRLRSPEPRPADAAKPGGTGIQTRLPGTPTIWTTTRFPILPYFRLASAGEWTLLRLDKLSDATFNWDTRTVADGRYEVKVVASDALANPVGDGKIGSRISDVLVVDNTALRDWRY